METASTDFSGELVVECRSCLRHLPGRRSAWRAACGDREVLLKIYDPHRKQKRDAYRDWEHTRKLAAAGLSIPDPLFLARGDGGVLVVAHAFIPDGRTLGEVLGDSDKPTQVESLARLMEIHGSQHARGCLQRDDHLGNYLWSRGQLYMLDAGSCELQPAPLPIAARVANLAVLAATIPLPLRVHYDAALPAYLAMVPDDMGRKEFSDAVARAEPKAVRARLVSHFRKTRRSCTEFEREDGPGRCWLACRTLNPRLKTALLNDPDGFFQDDGLLKDGNTCTVVEINQDGGQYVLKRYNRKSPCYRLRHMFLTPRALKSWTNGHVLRLFGIPTPRPLACLLLKSGLLPDRGYLLMEKVSGKPLSEVDPVRLADATTRHPEQFARRWAELDTLRASHGDLKASNFIIDRRDCLTLIDLDSLRFHRSLRTHERQKQKDLARFMRNWADAPAVQAAFRDALPSDHSLSGLQSRSPH